jgi:phage baseplate assembly protein W
MATLQDIRTQTWQLSIYSPGAIAQGLRSVQQGIDILLSTQRGSLVFDPDFGIDIMSYIGQPLTLTAGRLAQEIQDQIEAYVPLAEVIQISSEPTGDGKLAITVEWTSQNQTLRNTASYAFSS